MRLKDQRPGSPKKNIIYLGATYWSVDFGIIYLMDFAGYQN
jgi:hypothetical protein